MRWRIREYAPNWFIVERKGGLWWVNACLHPIWGYSRTWNSADEAGAEMRRLIERRLHQSRVIEELLTQ